MEEKKIRISLRYKLLLLLTILPLISLTLYLMMATNLFEKDKMAYVYDSSASNAKSLSSQVRLEVNAFVDRIRPIIESYDYTALRFSSSSIEMFNQQNRLEALVLFQKAPSGNYELLGELSNNSEVAGIFLKDRAVIEAAKHSTLRSDIFLTHFKKSKYHLVVGNVIGEKSDVDHLLLVSLYLSTDIHDAFLGKATLYSSFLLGGSGGIEMGADSVASESLTEKDLSMLFSPLRDTQLPEGTMESEIESRKFIVSYAKTGVGGMTVVSFVSKKAALKAVDVLVAKSIVFFVALIASTIIISLFASIQMTSTLRELYNATKKIAAGQFDIRVNATSRDEVGGLAQGFNFMAAEVSRLMSETAEKARMATELETVKTVQDNFFPPEKSSFGTMNIMGYFEPASECGGDWWYYSKVGDKIFLWIGDATGHGTPAALVTSAAKSAASIIELLPDMTPSKALEIMNKAICETSKGKILMTFFLASFDINTKKLVYANASHEPPYLLNKKDDGGKITKKDLVPLMEVNGPRLGDRPGATYDEYEIQLKKGDNILFYTDGIVDLQNPEGDTWGERKFIRAIMDSVSKENNVENKIGYIKDQIADYRQDSDLIDDITMFMCELENEAA